MKDQEWIVYRAIARCGHHVVRLLWNALISSNGTYATVLTLDCDCDEVDRCINEFAAVIFLEFDVAH